MDDIKTDTPAAIDFLTRWAPEGPWVLTAIQTDRKSIATATFYPKGFEAAFKWINSFNGKRNIYFHVNPVTRDLTKKANREDIKSMDWLHVDIDPRAGEDLEEERVRTLGVLTDKLPQGIPPPTCIVFSGGGYQGFWKLEEPIPIDGEIPKAEDAKRYNMQLELLFGGDNCHNIDRIMRLPGTINVPDARKIKKGRVPTLATLLEFNDNEYPLSKFTAAPAQQMEGDTSLGGGGTPKVQISGNVPRVDDVSELDEWDVPDRVKIIMAQGSHPEQKKDGDNSRSAWLFDFCCQLVRKNVPDDTIFSIITDPEWGISESVLEFKGNAAKYAIKQIESAKLWVIDPKLKWFSERYAVIKNYGGKCLMVTETFDFALKRTRLTKMTLENFEKGFENKHVQVGEDANGNAKFKPEGTWYRKHPERKQYETIVFAPEIQIPEEYYNLWKGFAVQSIPGECTLFLDHVRDNICGGNPEHYAYLMGWMARAVQNPAQPGEVAIVLRGGKGVGKSFFAKEFGALFGRHFMQVSNSSHLVGNFNSHLRDLVVLFADEAFYAGDKKHESILKTLVTEEMMAIEAKGIDVESAPNFIHLIMASNDIHVIPAGGDERRFFVTDVGSSKQQNSGYFKAIRKQMDNGGREALLHHLRTYDLEGYQVRTVPATDALKEQKMLSLNVEEEWWFHKLDDARTLRDGDDWLTEVSIDLLVDDYVDYTRRFNVSQRGNQITLGKFLKRLYPGITTTRRRAEVEIHTADGWTRRKTQRVSFYIMPPLAEARAVWDRMHGEEPWAAIADQPALAAPEDEQPPY